MTGRTAALLLAIAATSTVGCAPTVTRTPPPAVVEITDGAAPTDPHPASAPPNEPTGDIGLTIVAPERLASIPGLAGVRSTELTLRPTAPRVRSPGGCAAIVPSAFVAASRFERSAGPHSGDPIAVQAVSRVTVDEATQLAAALDGMRPGCRLSTAAMRAEIDPPVDSTHAHPSLETVTSVRPIDLSDGRGWVVETASAGGAGRLAVSLGGDGHSVVIVDPSSLEDIDIDTLAAIAELAIVRSSQ